MCTAQAHSHRNLGKGAKEAFTGIKPISGLSLLVSKIEERILGRKSADQLKGKRITNRRSAATGEPKRSSPLLQLKDRSQYLRINLKAGR